MAEVIRRFRPTPTEEYLANPHKGCCTFQHFNGDALFDGIHWSEEGPTQFPPRVAEETVPSYLPSTVAYCRWFWRLMEPEEGRYDFSVIDKALETAGQRGQTLAVRLMAFGSIMQPGLPEWYARGHPVTVKKARGHEILLPDHDAPAYLEHWGGLVREFARRYDTHPLMESIDITYIGPWGEGAGVCSREQCREFSQLWKEAFQHTPRIGMLGSDKMIEAVATGAGWRCDCFGDVSTPGSEEVPKGESWNHHFDSYPHSIYRWGRDVWQTAPVHLETCWVPMYWYTHGFDLDFILQQGLKFHATYFMPKSCRLPEAWMERLGSFCQKLGYRYVLRQALYSLHAPLDGEFRFQVWVENVGVAPLYRPYQLAIRLRQDNQTIVVPLPQTDMRTALPGDFSFDRNLPVPQGLKKGWVDLSIGIVDPRTLQAKVSFAVKERYADRWTPLGGFHLETPGD